MKKQFIKVGISCDPLIWAESDLPNAFLYITRLNRNKKTNNTFFELNIFFHLKLNNLK